MDIPDKSNSLYNPSPNIGKLFEWLDIQKQAYYNGVLDDDTIELLEDIDIVNTSNKKTR